MYSEACLGSRQIDPIAIRFWPSTCQAPALPWLRQSLSMVVRLAPREIIPPPAPFTPLPSAHESAVILDRSGAIAGWEKLLPETGARIAVDDPVRENELLFDCVKDVALCAKPIAGIAKNAVVRKILFIVSP